MNGLTILGLWVGGGALWLLWAMVRGGTRINYPHLDELTQRRMDKWDGTR